MKKKLILFLIIIASSFNLFAELNSMVELGWLADTDGSRLNFYLVGKDDNPKYLRLPSCQGDNTADCYVPLSKMKELRNFFSEVLKVVEPLDQYGIDSVPKQEVRELDVKGPEVLIFWNGDKLYNSDETYEGWNNLKAEWEFYRNIGNLSGSYIVFKTKVTMPNDRDEFRDFELRIQPENLKRLVKEMLNKGNIDRNVNGYRLNKFKNERLIQSVTNRNKI